MIGAGGGLIGQHTLVKEIIEALAIGTQGKASLSIKTRLGSRSSLLEREHWFRTLFELQQHVQLITVHGRTVKELSLVPARWDEIELVVQQRDTEAPKMLIFGNGDVRDVEHGLELAAKHRVDGVMIISFFFPRLSVPFSM